MDKNHRFELGTCTVPDGERGDWKIDTFTVTEDQARLESMRAICGGRGYAAIRAGTYRRLTHNRRGVVMSNTRMEVMTNMDAYIAATGRVLINGLGLGMLLEAILSKPDVTYVRVIEKEPDVIALVGPHFADDPRVEIVQADALTYAPAKGEAFDYAWHDIWDAICEDNLAEMATLGRRYGKRRAARQGWWARDIIKMDQRRFG